MTSVSSRFSVCSLIFLLSFVLYSFFKYQMIHSCLLLFKIKGITERPTSSSLCVGRFCWQASSQDVKLALLAPVLTGTFFFNVFEILFSYLFFREMGRGRETSLIASHMPPTGGLACNPGVCPDQVIKPATFHFTGQNSIH